MELSKLGSPTMLLLSETNVDKPKASNFADRIQMIMTVPDCLIGTCRYSRFVDKAKALLLTFPDTHFVFIMGADTVSRFFDSKYYEEMELELDSFFQNCSILSAARSNIQLDCKKWSKNVTFAAFEPSSISSTQARDLLKKYRHSKSSLAELKMVLPPKILDLILANEWYSGPSSKVPIQAEKQNLGT
jgi:nicotinic acid mononucleotide adenylyltransferase